MSDRWAMFGVQLSPVSTSLLKEALPGSIGPEVPRKLVFWLEIPLEVPTPIRHSGSLGYLYKRPNRSR